MTEEQELEIGRQNAPILLKQFGGEYEDEKLQAYISRLGKAIAESSDRPELFYHFYVVDSPITNAFALPGGYIFITRGLLAECNSEAEVAGVLAHEVGHVNARHAVQQMTKAQVVNMVGIVAQVMLGGGGNAVASDFRRLISAGILSGFSREAEYQADELSIDYLHRSNYNPYGTRNFLHTLNIAEEGKRNGFEGLFASHPDTIKRIARAKEIADKTGYQQSAATDQQMQDIYYKMIKGMVYGESAKEGYFLNNLFVHKKLGISLEFPKRWHYYNLPDKVMAMDQKTKEEQIKEAHEKKIKQVKVRRESRICQFNMEQLKKRYPLEKIVEDKFDNRYFKKLRQWEEENNGNHFLVVVYKVKNLKMRSRTVMTAFVKKGEILYKLSSVAIDSLFMHEMKRFKKFYRSLHFLTDKEKKQYKPPHIDIITAKKGDSFKNLAATYAHDEEMGEEIAKLNGIPPGTEPVAGQKLKVVVK